MGSLTYYSLIINYQLEVNKKIKICVWPMVLWDRHGVVGKVVGC